MKHGTAVAPYTLEELAEKVGNLRYDALSEFLDALSRKLQKDSQADLDRGRPQLSTALHQARYNLDEARLAIDEAWRISEPKMSENTEPPSEESV